MKHLISMAVCFACAIIFKDSFIAYIFAFILVITMIHMIVTQIKWIQSELNGTDK